MRLQATAKPDEYKVWLTDPELRALRRQASPRDKLIIDLGAYVGLRAFEIPQIKPKHVDRTDDGEHYRLRVPEGKDTANGQGKPRNAYLPADVEERIYTYTNDTDRGRDEQLIQLSTRSVRDVVKRTAQAAAEATGNPDYEYVSSHDLRRRFAQRLLVEKQMNPRVVMAVGGWDSFEAIEPYLTEPTPDKINDAFDAAGIS